MTEESQKNVAIPAGRSAWSTVRSWLRDLFIALALAAIVIIFLYQPVKVEGTSMWPGLEDQERIFINKFVYRVEAIQRDDVIVFHYPGEPSQSYIKRVIGLPGDTVKIVRGAVIVNGRALNEPYVPLDYGDTRSMAEQVVAPDCYFVLGDHRSVSKDSRTFGCVPRRYIYGKAVFVYWPVDKLGTLR